MLAFLDLTNHLAYVTECFKCIEINEIVIKSRYHLMKDWLLQYFPCFTEGGGDPSDLEEFDSIDSLSDSEDEARVKALMDLIYVSPEDPAATIGQPQLGFYVGDRYKVATNAVGTLHSICARLDSEDKSLRTFRRKLGFSQIVHKDLAPIIVECNTPDTFEVFAATTK